MSEPSQNFLFPSSAPPRPLDDHVTPPMALALGFGGLLPFIFCAAAIWLGWQPPLVPDPAVALMGYAAVILSFLGGVRWGLALRMDVPSVRSRALLLSVVPSIAAWLMLLPPIAFGLPAMSCLFLFLGILDAQLPRDGAPVWYALLRLRLTFIVAPSLAIATAGMRWAS